jgi:DNA (cytosine-5)-methyltransferase 1
MALETQKRQFIMKYGYHNPNNVQSLDDPCATLITTENQVLVTQFMTSAYTSSGKPETNIKSIDDPIGTIPCKDIHALVTQSQFIMSNYSTDKPEHMAHTIENPIPTLTTSNAHSIVSQIGGDIKIRFISVQEAKELQGFPADYKLVGNKAEQLRHIGNAVVPIMAKCLIEANYIETHDPLLSIMPGEMYEVCGEYEQQELAWR